MTEPVHEHPKWGGARVYFPPPFVFMIALVAGIAVNFLIPLRMPLDLIARILLAILFFAIGFGFIAWAIKLFRQTGQEPEPWKPSPEMIALGPYQYTRNPMYVGMSLIQAGFGFLSASWWVILLIPVSMLIVTLIAIKPEEAYLEEKFGESYRQYKARVRRWI